MRNIGWVGRTGAWYKRGMSLHVGCRTLSKFDPLQRAQVTAWLWYPTLAATQPTRFGAYSVDVAQDAEPAQAAQPFPLVALSHGNGSTPFTHRGLATHLVREGFAVVLIEHPGNNRNDNSLGIRAVGERVKLALLEHRPRHVVLAIDAALDDAVLGERLARGAYAIIGESIGAYTALAVAGGRAMTLPDDFDPAHLDAPAELARFAIAVPTQPDQRVYAAVLFSPALGFFNADGSLGDVTAPLLVRSGEHDAMCPTAQVRFSLRSVRDPARVQHLEVPGAGHFSFQTPYPKELAHLPSAQDPPGFDRAAYQATLHRDVTAFLRSATA